MTRPKPLTAAELRRHALPEVSGGDKDSHGAILIIAGSREVPGASLLTATAAMRSGAGKLQLAVPEEIAIPSVAHTILTRNDFAMPPADRGVL